MPLTCLSGTGSGLANMMPIASSRLRSRINPTIIYIPGENFELVKYHTVSSRKENFNVMYVILTNSNIGYHSNFGTRHPEETANCITIAHFNYMCCYYTLQNESSPQSVITPHGKNRDASYFVWSTTGKTLLITQCGVCSSVLNVLRGRSSPYILNCHGGTIG